MSVVVVRHRRMFILSIVTLDHCATPEAAGHRGRFNATVLENRQPCREHFVLDLSVEDTFPPSEPGQFVQIGCRVPDGSFDENEILGQPVSWAEGEYPKLSHPELLRSTAFLRRPFSLAARVNRSTGTIISLIGRVVGIGTQWLAELSRADRVDLIGPLGNSFTLPRSKRVGILVGGGVGLPPMLYLAGKVAGAGWRATAIVGAKTAQLLPVTLDPQVPPDPTGHPSLCVAEYARFGIATQITTDDGSLGLQGLITDGLTRLLDGMSHKDQNEMVVFACGPHPMLKSVAQLSMANDIECQLCLEQAMACGMGTCQSCVVKTNRDQGNTDAWRYQLVCSQGPVFTANTVMW